MKGVSLCTFTGEEIALLQQGGNDVFRKTFCATMPHDVTRPVDSGTESMKRWIEDVYVSKKYYKDMAESKRPPPLDTTESGDIAVIPLADVLGSDTPILRISMEVGEKMYEDPTTKETTPRGDEEEVEPAAGGNASEQHEQEWDPFGMSSASPSVDQSDGDALLLEEKKRTQPGMESPIARENTTETEERQDGVSFDVEWEAFAMDLQSSPADGTQTTSPAVPDAYFNQNPIINPEEELAKLDMSHHNGAGKEQREEETTTAAPVAPPRPEVPLDAFYPEFSKIRETGILPTGKPVPWHMQPQQKVMQVPPPPVIPHQAPPAGDQTAAAPAVPLHPEPPRASRPAVPTYDKATKTLFGKEKNLTAYDLSAQHAPKPNTTGNPFA